MSKERPQDIGAVAALVILVAIMGVIGLVVHEVAEVPDAGAATAPLVVEPDTTRRIPEAVGDSPADQLRSTRLVGAVRTVTPSRTADTVPPEAITVSAAVRMPTTVKPERSHEPVECTHGHINASNRKLAEQVAAHFDSGHALGYLCLWGAAENCGHYNLWCRLGGSVPFEHANADRGTRAMVCQLDVTLRDDCPPWRVQYPATAAWLDDPHAVSVDDLMDEHRVWCTSVCTYRAALERFARDVTDNA